MTFSVSCSFSFPGDPHHRLMRIQQPVRQKLLDFYTPSGQTNRQLELFHKFRGLIEYFLQADGVFKFHAEILSDYLFILIYIKR